MLNRFRVWLWRKRFLKALSGEFRLRRVSWDDMCILTGDVCAAEGLDDIAACYFRLGMLVGEDGAAFEGGADA